MNALSVVEKAGRLISSGAKSLEIRRWAPNELPLLDLAIVQNGRRLTQEDPIDPDGNIVAVVDVQKVRDWSPADAEAACSDWEKGWLAWEICNVRKVAVPVAAQAERKIYQVDCVLEDLQIEGSG